MNEWLSVEKVMEKCWELEDVEEDEELEMMVFFMLRVWYGSKKCFD